MLAIRFLVPAVVMATLCSENLPFTFGENSSETQTNVVCVANHNYEFFLGGWTDAWSITGEADGVKRPILIRMSESWNLISAVKVSFTPQREEIVACEQNEAISRVNLFFSLPVVVVTIVPTTLAVSSVLEVGNDGGLDATLFSLHGASLDSFYGYVMLAINTQFQPFLLSINLNAGADYGKIAFQHELFASTATIISMDGVENYMGVDFEVGTMSYFASFYMDGVLNGNPDALNQEYQFERDFSAATLERYTETDFFFDGTVSWWYSCGHYFPFSNKGLIRELLVDGTPNVNIYELTLKHNSQECFGINS